MDKKEGPSYQNTGNQGLLAGRDNPGYGCVLPVPPPAVNPPINSNPVIAQPGFQDNQRLSGNGTHSVTVVRQAPIAVNGTFPSTHWGLALFSLICCFWPLGVLALIYSHRARDAIIYGDFASAKYYSKKSKDFSIVSIVIGLLCTVGVVIFLLV